MELKVYCDCSKTLPVSVMQRIFNSQVHSSVVLTVPRNGQYCEMIWTRQAIHSRWWRGTHQEQHFSTAQNVLSDRLVVDWNFQSVWPMMCCKKDCNRMHTNFYTASNIMISAKRYILTLMQGQVDVDYYCLHRIHWWSYFPYKWCSKQP